MNDDSQHPPEPDQEDHADHGDSDGDASNPTPEPPHEHSPLPTDLADDLFFEDTPGAEERRARMEERRRRRGLEPAESGPDQPVIAPPKIPTESVGDRVGDALAAVRRRVSGNPDGPSGSGSEPPPVEADHAPIADDHTAAPVDDWFDEEDSAAASKGGGASGRLRAGLSGAGAGGALGGGAGGGPSGPADVVMRRRILAVGGLFGVAVVLFVAVKAFSGGSEPLPPPEPVATFDITIPEGLGRTQVAKVVKKAGVKGNYKKATKKAPKGFDPADYGVKDPASLEGFLFPATYELEEGARVGDLVTRQLAAFEERMSGINLKKAQSKNLTGYDVVIVASMIEREVQVDSERRKVAAVIYNRLASGEPLGIDSTTRYELNNYDKPLLESELAADTPYNTRLNAGLPPTPIGNPGLASLEAAAKPANSDIRYFVVKPYTCNEHTFTADPNEFLQAQAEYQAALAAEGGAPTSCPDGK